MWMCARGCRGSDRPRNLRNVMWKWVKSVSTDMYYVQSTNELFQFRSTVYACLYLSFRFDWVDDDDASEPCFRNLYAYTSLHMLITITCIYSCPESIVMANVTHGISTSTFHTILTHLLSFQSKFWAFPFSLLKTTFIHSIWIILRLLRINV